MTKKSYTNNENKSIGVDVFKGYRGLTLEEMIKMTEEANSLDEYDYEWYARLSELAELNIDYYRDFKYLIKDAKQGLNETGKTFYSVEDEMFDGHNNYESVYFETFQEAKEFAMGLNPIAGGTHTVSKYIIDEGEDMEDAMDDGKIIFDTKPISVFEGMSEDEFAEYLMRLKDFIDYGLMSYDLVYWFDLHGTNYKVDFFDDEIDEYLESQGRSTDDVDYQKLIDEEGDDVVKYLIKEYKDRVIKEIAKFGDK